MADTDEILLAADDKMDSAIESLKRSSRHPRNLISFDGPCQELVHQEWGCYTRHKPALDVAAISLQLGRNLNSSVRRYALGNVQARE